MSSNPDSISSIAFVSLGCPKNLVDSEKMLGTLTQGNGLMGAMQMASGGLLGSLIIFVGGDEKFSAAILCLLILSFLSIVCCLAVCQKGNSGGIKKV